MPRAADVEHLLANLVNLRATGTGWTALCPAHDDREPSLSIGLGDDGRILLNCFAGCATEQVVEALGLTLADLFPSNSPRASRRRGGGRPTPPQNAPSVPPVTLGLTMAQYARAKRLREELLRGLGLRDLFLRGRPAVAIPYKDVIGAEVSVRFRLALEGPDRFRWRKGSKAMAYGLWRLADARRLGHIVLVEGESDAQTLWLHGIPALGIPGSDTWREEWADHLRDIPTIYVLVEPDAGGERVLAWLARSSIRDRAHLVTLDGLKDPSALHIADPDHFIESWNAALSAAPTWVDREQRIAGDRRQLAWTQCRALAEEPNILSRFIQTVAECGIAGEERAVKLLYLQATSRLLKAPVSLSLKGPSAAGKSYLANRVLDFFPKSAYYALTAMSERALAYSAEPLAHRLLVIYEAAGIHGDFATYLVRSLLSEGRVSYETVEKTPQGLRARRIERAGPTNLLVTTTAVALHPENETRMLSVPITDTQDQTRRVLLAIAEDRQQPADVTVWHALQEWLALSEHRVQIPYARVLAHLIRPVATRLRRDFRMILSLIEAHAILHQANRERSPDGAVVADIDDYAVIRQLVADLVAEGVEATVSRTIRETVAAVQTLLRHRPPRDEVGVSLTAVAERLELDISSARRRVQIALRKDYLKNLETRKYRPYRLQLGDPLPEDAPLLPLPADLASQGWGLGLESEGSSAPPPPSSLPLDALTVEQLGMGPGPRRPMPPAPPGGRRPWSSRPTWESVGD